MSVWVWLAGASFSGCKNSSGPVREIDGAKSFVRHCARCHGADGAGVAKMQPIPDFRSPSWQASRSDAQLRRAIQMGVPPRMPAYGRRFMEPTQASLVGAIRRLVRPVAHPPAAVQGGVQNPKPAGGQGGEHSPKPAGG